MSKPRPPQKRPPPPGGEAQLHDYLEGERALLELRCCKPKTLSALIHDLAHPMSPSLEQAIARCLAGRELEGFAPAETLLPVMMRRLTVTGSTLRAQPPENKARIADGLLRNLWPMPYVPAS